ncbi:MAG: hypothetical protein BMS9Abin28_1517 [Anaerolineae bacterium]|nr:MAG: hypothetical protein BMS9Abin28_1517 [Anaerolineae bacterium]
MAVEQAGEPGRRARTGRRIASLALVGLGVVLILFSAAFFLYTNEIRNPDDVALPANLAGYPLRAALYGKQAIADVSRLHGKEFPLSSGGVGMYGERGEVTLWATGTPADFLASRMLEDMVEAIAQSDSPFVPRGELERDGRRILELDGMGQRHFYFQAGRLVIWLAADPALADDVLREALAFYP